MEEEEDEEEGLFKANAVNEERRMHATQNNNVAYCCYLFYILIGHDLVN